MILILILCILTASKPSLISTNKKKYLTTYHTVVLIEIVDERIDIGSIFSLSSLSLAPSSQTTLYHSGQPVDRTRLRSRTRNIDPGTDRP
jgi:hypothetical protein